MIEKMKFVTITGPKEDFDRVVGTYLGKYEIHLENALSELNTVKTIRPFSEPNPYKEYHERAESLIKLLPHPDYGIHDSDVETAKQTIDKIEAEIAELRNEKDDLTKQLEQMKTSLGKIANFRELDYNLETILKFKFIKYRFGRMPHEYYDKFLHYVYADLDTFFYKCHEDSDYVWGVYFVPHTKEEKVDAVYSSLHFERFYVPDEYRGTPNDAYEQLEDDIRKLETDIADMDKKVTALVDSHAVELSTACEIIERLSSNFDIRRMAALTTEGQHVFYILCGWMPAKSADRLAKEVENDSQVYCIFDDSDAGTFSSPPTKLKNLRIFRPFQMFIEMYGLPAYNEVDPTVFVALTYSFIFGAMFGDVGQGLLLAVLGLVIYRVKKLRLATIISCAGIFSTIFGFMFGSIFGFEDILPAIWLRPVNAMSTLPFIGKLNTVFVVAIAFGICLILLTMVLHIINAVKAKDTESLLFDTNGIAGLVFYASAAVCILLFMNGKPLPGAIILIVMFVIPLLLIAAKEPLTALITKKHHGEKTGAVMFVVQAFFELFEMLLSYFSNTLSFVRIGAFAVSHAAMMEVVMMLAGAESGSPNMIVVVIGNLAVCLLEGLIVGIQVLRLEYYEMFSRFYKGTGKPFKPYSFHK